MDDNQPKLEFFSDIRDKFFLILGGIISLTTVIPAFLNKTAEIFGWEHIYVGYYVFVAIYFIFPYIFYLLYCSIHDDVGYLELLPTRSIDFIKQKKGIKTIIELALPLLVWVYLILPGEIFDISFSVIFCGASLFCFIWFTILFYDAEALRKEVLVIGISIILLFGLFFYSVIQREHQKDNRLFAYSRSDQDSAFDAYETRDKLNDFSGLLDSIKKVSYRYHAQASLLYSNTQLSAIQGKNCDQCNLEAIYNPMVQMDTVRHLNKNLIKAKNLLIRKAAHALFQYEQSIINSGDGSKIYQVLLIDKYCYYLDEYGSYIQKAKLLLISAKWAKLLKVLQYKSLAWFFFLIVTGLCLWFKLQVRLSQITNANNSKIPLITDDISQIKSLIFLLFILIAPWFRTIDAKDVELDKPFLNISLNNLVNGHFGPEEPANANVSKTTATDSLWIIGVKGPGGKPGDRNKTDSILNRIDQHVSASEGLTRSMAKRLIGSAEDRGIFNEKKNK